MRGVVIKAMPAPRAAKCRSVMLALPEWFGIESYIESYAQEAEALPTFGAYDSDGTLLGFMTLKAEGEGVNEIHAMGVLPHCQGCGIGMQLVMHAQEVSRQEGCHTLRVRTLGPSKPDPYYDRMRAFYGKAGYRSVEERLDVWPDNPCLVMEFSLDAE